MASIAHVGTMRKLPGLRLAREDYFRITCHPLAIRSWTNSWIANLWPSVLLLHNGGAASLNQVVDFYNQRFQINLTDQEKAQLVAFLQTL